MINLLWSAVFMLLLLSGCGWNGTPTRINDFTPLTSIEISADTPTIAAGTSTKLSVKGNFSGLFTRDITDQAVWSSDSTTVAGFATAASPNRVTGHVPGTATLTATVGSVSATFKLTVSSATITALTITPAAPTIAKGLNTQFAVSGAFSDSTTLDLTNDVTWDSSDTTVATISDIVDNKRVVKALAVGTSTITATFTFNGIRGTALLTVTEPMLQSIALSPANPSVLSLSTTDSFTATGTYSDGSTKIITDQVNWASSSTGIATIATTGGAAKTLSQGTTSISATPLPSVPSAPGVSGTTNLKVTGGNLNSFTVSPATVILANNTLVRMTVIGSFSDGTNVTSRDITRVVAWSVANPALATVTAPSGNLAWLNALAVTGATTVTATSGTLTAITNLTVTAPLLLSIAIFPPSLDLTAGTSARFTATGNFSDGTTQDVTANITWLSSDAAIASVGNTNTDLANKGRVSGVDAAVSPVTITATFVGVTPVTAPVTVTVRPLQSLTILPVAATVGSGNQFKFTATANYNGFSQDVTEDTTWSIDKPNIAILADINNQPGQVVGVDSGSATLTASFGGMTPTATVIVP
jgi:Big-like domain-containing protein